MGDRSAVLKLDVLDLQLLQPLGFAHRDPNDLAAPQVAQGFTEAMLARERPLAGSCGGE